jgi:hypothetical protein
MKHLLICLLWMTAPLIAQTNPCDEPADLGGGEGPIDPDLDEPGPLGEDEIGCYDNYHQWVPGGFMVYTWHDGELLGSECVPPANEFKRATPDRYTIDGYLVMDISAHGHDLENQPTHEKQRIRADNAWLLGIDLDDNGALDNRYELFQGTRNVPNAVIALAEFDRPRFGGNDDGLIDDRDAVWDQLYLRDITGEITLPVENLGIRALQTIPRADDWPRYQRMTIDATAPDGTLAYTLTTFAWRHIDFGGR